jgi:hypothetical protein
MERNFRVSPTIIDDSRLSNICYWNKQIPIEQNIKKFLRISLQPNINELLENHLNAIRAGYYR